jgi:single-strand DNA-binding protein
MNRVTLIANLVRDPEMGQTTSGMATCKFTVACNNGKDKDGNERPADFITCKAFDKKAETIGRYFKKGKPICVTGSFKTDKYQDKNHDDVTHYSSYVLVNEFEFVGGKSDGGSAESEKPAEKPAPEKKPVEAEDADCPF